MRVLIVMFISVSWGCFAQIASVPSISTAGGFLDTCGRSDTSLSKEQMDTLKNAPPSEYMEQLKKALADRTAEVAMCVAFVSGLEQGWKEGHEHGVIAAQFPYRAGSELKADSTNPSTWTTIDKAGRNVGCPG